MIDVPFLLSGAQMSRIEPFLGLSQTVVSKISKLKRECGAHTLLEPCSRVLLVSIPPCMAFKPQRLDLGVIAHSIHESRCRLPVPDLRKRDMFTESHCRKEPIVIVERLRFGRLQCDWDASGLKRFVRAKAILGDTLGARHK